MNDILLLALMFTAFHLSTAAWQNDYDSSVYLQCPRKYALYRIQNEYSYDKQGRRWDYKCRRVNPAIGSRYPERCPATDNRNKKWVGDELHMTCPIGSVLRKVWFYRRMSSEDLRWRLTCCRDSRNRHTTRNCSVTGWVNDWNRSFDYSAPANKVLNGIVVKWSRRFLDRIFKFSICDYN